MFGLTGSVRNQAFIPTIRAPPKPQRVKAWTPSRPVGNPSAACRCLRTRHKRWPKSTKKEKPTEL
ncbi:hypothetical protein B0T26DRAFT_705738 [Lasiosphaeria miniovina]|uniref:Uncharacterized protein n=1 Tax=Lasiosphaeria miniovina TaxID=1954250 RepID=A0AA40AW98_9PEZI|nr:uncharacterized protein B0T26DRAFT_705738 [Lasiosphaeria miniovina]KAK0723197.1 hypothetical protein B0T26DRAFT_705738 [Lasiosphaeria miniovina]